MSLQEELQAVGNAVRDLKKQIRRVVLRELGVDRLVKEAFKEGWEMRGHTDSEACLRNTKHSKTEVDGIILYTRVWRSVEEAWTNSDVEEKV